MTENSEEGKVADEAKREVFTGSFLYFLIVGMLYWSSSYVFLLKTPLGAGYS